MPPPTVFLGKFFGLFCLLLCATLLARPKASQAAMDSLMTSPGLVLVTGIVTMAGGVATVLAHNVWSGGALPVAVTLLGWITLLKGLALMAAPADALGRFYRTVHVTERFRLIMTACLVFSLWLTAAAFSG